MQQTIRNVILTFITVIIIFFLGCLTGKSLAPDIDTIKQNIEQEIIENLSQKFNLKTEKGLVPFITQLRAMGTRTSLNGEVVSVDFRANIIKVNTPNLYEGNDFLKYLNQPDYYIKTVEIVQETEIVEQVSKTREQHIEEMKAYEEEGNRGPLPNFYEENQFSMEAIKEGLEIFIDTESEFKLEEAEIIQAAKITVRK